jgi:hypothetical protein
VESAYKKKLFGKKFYYLLKKRIIIERNLSILLKKKVEVKLKNFLKSSVSEKFKLVYKSFYNHLLLNRVNFFNKQFKEVYSMLSLGIFLVKAKLVVSLLATVLGYGRYRYFKKNMYYLFNLIECLQNIYSYKGSIRINISGKFKGKAKRTQLKYLKTPGRWNVRTVDSSIIDYYVGFVGTKTGIFGIKV